MSLYYELKRRNVIRVGVAYLASSWLLIEVASILFPAFGIPDWATRFIVLVCALGFIPALIFSWLYELTPDGLKREKDVDRASSISRQTAKRLDEFTIGLIVLALVVVFVDRIWLDPAQVESLPEAPVQHAPSSIAVLPFVNMSDDASNEYFSDGVSEELLTLLAQIPELKVTSRTSAFSFKGKSFTIAEAARELNVAHILEGSVRKDGDRVRITAQLIHAASDTHLWSETYSRTLDDIFTIQNEIAETVVDQLKLQLLGDAPTIDTTDPEAYALYLQARHLGYRLSAEASNRSNTMYRQALAIDPAYAAAWSGLASNYLNQYLEGELGRDESIRLAREAANRALAIDPSHAPAYAHLSRIELTYDRNLRLAAQHLEHALRLEPSNPDILRRAVYLAYRLGHLDEAVAVGEYVVARDPVNPESHYYLGIAYLWARQLDAAIASFRNTLALSPGRVAAHYRIAVSLLLKGELQEAQREARQEPFEAKRLEGQAITCHALGQEAESDAALMELIEKFRHNSAYNIAYVLAFRGEADRAFAWLEHAVSSRDSGLTQIAGQPEFANIHDDPRWLPFLESIGVAPGQLEAIEFNVEPIP